MAFLSFQNELFSKFAFYSAVLLLKTISMSIYTIFLRRSKEQTALSFRRHLSGSEGVNTQSVRYMCTALQSERDLKQNVVFMNEEDCKFRALRTGRELKPIYNDPDVDRSVRAHRNDLENIVPFCLVGFLYVLTEPSLSIASLHFRVFAIARIVHTVAYLKPLPVPWRPLAFAVGWLVNSSMLIQVLQATAW